MSTLGEHHTSGEGHGRAGPRPRRKAQFYSDPDRKPVVLGPDLDHTPVGLRSVRRWVLWRLVWKPNQNRGGKWDKVPFQPDGQPAKSNDPTTWTTFEAAADAYRAGGFDGISFALGDGFVGIDLDDVRDPDTSSLTPDAAALVERIATYCEVSPSGTGLKLIGLGVWRADWHRKPMPDGGEVEAYSACRFFALTGHPIGDHPLADIQAAADELAERFAGTARPPTVTPTPVSADDGCDDEEVIRRAEDAGNGAKFRALWAGDTSGYDGDASRADLALCGLLAFWCQGDAARIDRLFRRSGLIRPKWDLRRGESTYGQRTIAKALEGKTEFYTPEARSVGPSGATSRTGSPAGGSARPAPPGGPARELISRTAAEVTRREVEWLWPDRVPLGMVSEWIGDPGLGKSCGAVGLAAVVTTGDAVPLHPEHRVGPAAVVLVSGEESWECVIKPRLAAAGADMRRVHTVEGVRVGDDERPVRFPEDLDLVEQKVIETGAKLLVIDPLNDHVAPGIDTHKDAEMRSVTRQLKQLAERTGAAVLVLRHPNKGAGGPAIYRGGGTLGVTAAARVSLVAGRHPDRPDTFVLAGNKSNVGRLPRAVVYSILSVGGQPVVAWGEECDLTADDIMAVPDRKAGERLDGAVEFLRRELAAGWQPQKQLAEKAEAEGISESSLRRAKKRLGITATKRGYKGSWGWALPGEATPEGTHGSGESPNHERLWTEEGGIALKSRGVAEDAQTAVEVSAFGEGAQPPEGAHPPDLMSAFGGTTENPGFGACPAAEGAHAHDSPRELSAFGTPDGQTPGPTPPGNGKPLLRFSNDDRLHETRG
jgi:hypothetical protein